jgi:fructoselysine-6-P-deglycase FrlB-like protein
VRRDSHAPLPGAPDPWATSEMPAFRSRPPYLMTEMVAAEPALAERLLHRLTRDDAVDRVASLVREAGANGQSILLTGAGTSEHAAMGVAELLNEALAGTRGVAVARPPL